MKIFAFTALAGLMAVALALAPVTGASPTAEADPSADSLAAPPSADEARGRSRLLHEAMHATLQIVHHEYYREDEGITIPAATLQRVFAELASRQKVELRWLAVNAEAMNTDHKPRDEFEKQAVVALAAGKEEYEAVENGIYRRAGTIALTSNCLKCHAKPHQ